MTVKFERAGDFLARVAQGCAAIVLLGLLVLTCADVFGRYILLQPVNGKTELTRMLMAVMIALVLPVVAARNEHITVDLFDSFFRGRVQRWRDLCVDSLAATSFLVLAWWVGFRAMRLMAYGYASDFLRLPLHPVAFFVAAMIGLAGAALVVRIGLDVARLARPDDRSGPDSSPGPDQRLWE
jgi:TRAP-type C4-dicarboxylate transport system permease small subunit